MEYQKPTINKVDFRLASKYGSPLKEQRIKGEIDGVPVKELVEKFGSPLFVFSQRELEEKYREYKTAFSSRYPNVQFWWSYKTNYLDAICKIFHKLGSKAEVVSEFEYQKARRLGVEGRDIIFNGPYKPKHILRQALQEGAMIHIDHFYEINDIEDVARELGLKEVGVAIRCNMNTGVYPQWSRFGFNIENGEAYEAVRRLYKGGILKLVGLHAHIGTFMLSSSAYRVEVEKLMRLKNWSENQFGVEVEYIDIGGGFASRNRLKGVYQPPEVIVPSPDEYAEAVTGAIYDNYQGKLPKLYLETGRALVDEAGYLLTSVFATKRLPDGKKGYVVDAGVNLLYTAFWYNFELFLDKRYEGLNEPSQVNGPLCMNIDVIAENVMLPPLERGTIMTIWPVGAYNYPQSMQFIQYRPRVVLIDTNGTPHLIREADDLNYVVEKEVVLDYLK
jgi:diaminopimelate decarboxylase